MAWDRRFRSALIIVWLACAVFGAIQLGTSKIELTRFWDEADLLWDIGLPDFASQGGRLGTISYATRKIGYAYPAKLCLGAWGDTGVVVWNLLWLAIIILLPVPGVRQWQGYAFKAGAVLSLPYTVKYVAMINPTIQAMGLWLVLATVFAWWRRTSERSRLRDSLYLAALGVIGGLIVVTDFKWLPFVVASVILLLWLNPPNRFHSQRGIASWWQPLRQWVIPNGIIALVWMVIVLGVTALLFRPYGDMVYNMLFALPGKVGVVRPGISDNLLVHLWYLGGFGIVVGAVAALILCARDERACLRESSPYWLPAALICVAFSVIVWPRGARMFAPGLVLAISLAAAILLRSTLQNVSSGKRAIRWAILILVTLPMLVNVLHVRDALETPTGLDDLRAHIRAHTVGPHGGAPDEEPLYEPPLMGGYMLPLMIMRASRDGDMPWFSPAAGLREASNWVILNPVTDPFTLEEQAAGGAVEAGWKQDQYYLLESLTRFGKTVATFPAPFYSTPYYICELAFEGDELVRAIDSRGLSEWQVVFIGGFSNREFPGTDSTEIAP